MAREVWLPNHSGTAARDALWELIDELDAEARAEERYLGGEEEFHAETPADADADADFLRQIEGDVEAERRVIRESERVAIDVKCQHLPTLNALCWDAIRQQNGDGKQVAPQLFLFGGQIVRASQEADGNLKLEPATSTILRNTLSRWADWYKLIPEAPAKPPKDVIEDVLATASPELPILKRIVGVPVFSPAGELNLRPGFDATSGVYYSPARGFAAKPIGDIVTNIDLARANQLLCEEVLVDFPFATKADRDNAIALFLLPFVRDMINEATPNHLVEAPMQASGKGKLARALIGVSCGANVGVIVPTGDDEEWRKRITSALMLGRPVIMIDNVIKELNSASLASAWTEIVWEDRALGSNKWVSIPIRCVWVTTANNMMVSNDLSTRNIRIRIEPQTARPAERTNFRHPDLIEWCEENRADLVWAAHVIVKWWIQCGRPKANRAQTTRYSQWERLMGGILETAGYRDFLGNQREFQSSGANSEALARAAFCEAWYAWAGGNSGDPDKKRLTNATAGDLIDIAESVEGFVLNGTTPRARVTSLGNWLQQNKGALIESEELLDDDKTVRTRLFKFDRWPLKYRNKTQWSLTLKESE